jgi:hypothetical protein
VIIRLTTSRTSLTLSKSGNGSESATDAAVLSSADPAQFCSLLGVGVDEAESAFSGGGPTGLAALSLALTTGIRIIRSHLHFDSRSA